MVEARVSVRKVGGSLMMTIPKEIVKYKGIKAGTQLTVDIRDDDDEEKDYFGAFPGLGPWVKQDPSIYSKLA